MFRFVIGKGRTLVVLSMAVTALLACSPGQVTDRHDAGYYHVACPYCSRDGYWSVRDVKDNGSRARCVDRSCNEIFTISADASRTALPQTLTSNQQVPVNYLSQCPYCGFRGYWPIARVQECGGNAKCNQGCGGTFRIVPDATNSSQVLNARPFVAENGSYYGQLNKYGIPKTVHVRSYLRKDGTYVRSHFRGLPRRR